MIKEAILCFMVLINLISIGLGVLNAFIYTENQKPVSLIAAIFCTVIGVIGLCMLALS